MINSKSVGLYRRAAAGQQSPESARPGGGAAAVQSSSLTPDKSAPAGRSGAAHSAALVFSPAAARFGADPWAVIQRQALTSYCQGYRQQQAALGR